MAGSEGKLGDQSGEAKSVPPCGRRAEPRGPRSCWNVGQDLLYRDGPASGWKASLKDA